jgi:hypothetical protein
VVNMGLAIFRVQICKKPRHSSQASGFASVASGPGRQGCFAVSPMRCSA